MYDIIIIGAGPAGLTAAIYAKRASKSCLILEAKSFGGQIVNTPDIENYPTAEHMAGFEFAMKLYTQAINLGAALGRSKRRKMLMKRRRSLSPPVPKTESSASRAKRI